MNENVVLTRAGKATSLPTPNLRSLLAEERA
jgi:hypothetical protein